MMTKKSHKPSVQINISGDNLAPIAVGSDNDVSQNSSLSANKTSTKAETFFDVGYRLRQVREEINLKSSEFVEVFELSSEKTYLQMEKQIEEVPLSLLKKVHIVTGVSLEWLKHGESPMYKVEGIYLMDIKEGLKRCAEIHPVEYFFTLELKSLHVGLIAQTGEYRHQVFDTGVTLDFWNWIDAHWAIAQFYKFLKALSDPWHDIRGIVLSPNDDKKLYAGNTHFLGTSGKLNLNIVYDILDLNETRLRRSSYSRMYSGNWMSKVHDYFREYLKLDAERMKNHE
jgi:hypothetical protein